MIFLYPTRSLLYHAQTRPFSISVNLSRRTTLACSAFHIMNASLVTVRATMQKDASMILTERRSLVADVVLANP